MSHSSSENRSEVASPSSVCRRQTNPGDASAIALIGCEVRDEVGELRRVERRRQPGDVDLREMGSRHRAEPSGSDPSPTDARIASTSSAARSKRPNCGIR